MNKSRDINTSKFMSIIKSGRNKRIAAATTAVLLTGAVIASSVFGSTQAAENADTLMGIEKLRKQFSEGNEYTVLEIVPDINAAEIGYLFDGYEPVLSEWDSETMTWKSWKDVLCSFDTKPERQEFMKRKTEALKEYYAARGIEDNFPVTIPTAEEYDDSEDYIDGYEEVEASSYDMTGYFVPVRNNTGKYYVSFEYVTYENIVEQPDAVYYTVSGRPQPIVSSDMNIADGTYIYKVDGALYQCVGTWGDLLQSGLSFPSASEEKVPDDNDSDDNKDRDDKKNDDNTDEDGNDDGENETGDDGSTTGGDGNGDSGNETGNDGSVDGGNETGEGNNGDNENDNSDADNVDSNNRNGSNSNENNGNTGSNGTNNVNSDSINSVNMVGSTTSANKALGNSFANVKWVKYVSTADDNTKTSDKDSSSDKKENSNSENSGSVDNNSNENKNDSSSDNNQGGESGNSSDNNQSDNSDNNTGNDNGDASGDNNGDNQGDNADDNAGDNKGDESDNNTGDNKDDKPGNNTGDNKGDKPGDNKGDGSGDNTGDNKGDESGDNTGDNNGDESGDNSDDNQGDGSDDDSDEDKKGSDKDSDKNSEKDNSIEQTAQAQPNDNYYLVYFERATNIDALSTTGAYVVNSIKPAKLGIGDEYYTGQYDFVEDKDGDNTQTYTFPGRILYCNGVFHNNEWFKQYVINMNKENFDNFKVKVITLTPDMLNKIYEGDTEEYEQGSIPDFDFLYLNSGLRTSEIDITEPSGEDTGNAPKPDKDEGTDADKTGDDDKTGDNGDADKTGDDDKTGDNGDADKTGDDDKTGDNGDADKTGDDDNTGDNGDTDKTGDDDKASDNGDTDKTGDDDNTGDNGNTDNSGDGGSTVDNGRTDNYEDDNNTGDNTNTGNSSYSNKSSLWKAFVSKDDSADASKSEAVADSDTSNKAGKDAADNKADDNGIGNTGNTGSTGNEDNTDTADDTNNNDTSTGGGNNGDTTDDTNSNDDTDNKGDNTGDADNTDDSDSKDNTDSTDGDNTGDATNPDNSEEGNDDGEADKEDPSSGSGNKTDNKSNSSVVLYSTASDLEPKVANLLFNKVAAKGLPCLVDGSILYGKTEGSGAIFDKKDTTEHTEVFRLAAMLCQETLEKDYTGVSKKILMDGIVDADKNFTTEQVYCRLGNGEDSIINDNFFKYTIYKEGGDVEEGFQNVLDEIKLENLYRESDSSGHYKPLPTNIAQAEAVRHILNYQNRRSVDPKKSIKVLEIQPAYTTKPELTKKQLQKWAPGVEEVETTIMTTAEFIGKIDKLNEIYDLIYIGTSKEHLNISNWVTDTGKSKDNKYLGSTVFNDSDMDGLIYYNIGDKRVVNLPMSGLLDSEYKSGNGSGRTYYYNFARYSGNDITKEKKEALISFLDGSYPIVISDEFIEQPVTVFEDEDYAGRRATLNVGEYKEENLLENQVFAASGTPAKGISSIQVKKGYQITLFEEPDFKGKSITITEDVKNLTTSKVEGSGQTWNNRCRSAIVEKVEDAQPVRKLDGNHIDNSSYLYEFVNTAMEKKYTNFYAYGDIDESGSEIFKFYLNRPKADLAEFTANGFIGGSYDGSATFNDVYYIYPNTLGKYTLQYSFTIKNEGAASVDTQYDCKLYIDVNADGKFSGNEMFSDITILNRQTGGIVSKDDKGIYHLYADVPYTITRDVPDGYKGLLPWNVEVCQVNNDNIYASEQGYTKLSGMETETLKICQINKNTTNEYRIIDLNYEVETKGRYFNTLVYGGDYDGVHYSGITDDFELDIESINISTFEDYYNSSSENYNPDYLKDFNMLILGFSDAYDDFSGDPNNSKTALGAVIEFIDSGKSVLMGHDNTSYWNNPIVDNTQMGYTDRRSNDLTEAYKPDTRFAANINAYIRPLVGMDRYGVLSSSVVKKGVSLKKDASGWSELLSSGKDIAYKPKSGRTETVPEAQGFTSTIINVRDTDEKSVEKRDYTKYNLYSNDYNNRSDFSNKYLSQRYDTVYYSEKSSDNGEINTETSSQNTSGKVQNVHVTQVNKGQITEYPYKLKEDFEVGQTHGQYYQLDYTADDDADGQSDLVVWYCLGARTSGSGKTDTIYSQSPNDVRNNYYIYNKGNITYTGMGHGANDRSAKAPYAAYTFEEAKLFINTIIASYQAGVKAPSITVLDSGREDSSVLTTMYRYYDEANMMSLADISDNGQYEKVYFTVRDINFVNGDREMTSHAYYHVDGVAGTETISVGGEEISVNSLVDLIYDPDTDELVDATKLVSGKIYYLLIPRTVMNQCENGLDIYFEAWSKITTNTTKKNEYETDKVYAKLKVLRAYLFELD